MTALTLTQQNAVAAFWVLTILICSMGAAYLWFISGGDR